METCGTERRHHTRYSPSAAALHYKSASDGDSPDASMPMGSLANALVDSGYREGSVTYNHSPLTDEVPTSSVPPAITPVSGQLEKFKKHHMIRPVPVKAASPSRSLESPSSTSSRHSIPGSPANMPDHAAEQKKHHHHHHQPPDLVLTNQQQSFAGNHFAGLPTKCLSLQDITPKQKNHHENRKRVPSYGDSKGWGKQPVQARPIQPAHSLNHLNRNLQSHKLLPDYRRRDISQSANQVDGRHHRSNGHKKPVRVTHTNPSYGHAMDYNSNRLDGKSSASNSSRVSSVMEESEMGEIAALRQKVLEKEAQLSTLRDTMDNNEAVILKVHEEKRQQWEEETSWLRKELQDQEDTSRKIRHSLQTQIYKLEQEKKSLREKIEATQQPASKEAEDLKWQLRNLRDQLSIKSQEMSNLRMKLAYQEQHLNEKAKTVASLQAELERNPAGSGTTKEDHPDTHQRRLKEREAELNEARTQTNHLQELKDNLAKEVKVQQEELNLLRNKISCKDKELSQERCEITYLREVQEKLNLQLQRKSKSGGGLLGRGNQSGNSNQLKDKLFQKEKEVSHVKEQLKKIQDEKEQETGKLRQTLKERTGEIERLQKKISETEKDRGLLRNKLANGKGGGVSKMTPLQRQLESDFMDLQVKLTSREREVFQLKRELGLLQEKKDSDLVSLKSQVKDQEREHTDLQNKLHQRETDISFLMDKLKSRDSEITSLQEKLGKLKTDKAVPSDTKNGTQTVEELRKELAAMELVHQDLDAQVADLKEESAMYKDKLDQIYQGVRSLSTSQSNLVNAHLAKDRVPGTGTRRASEERPDKEMRSLKAALAEARGRVQSQEATMAQERRIWQEEKEKVIKYQKQLQLNYVQMCRRNRTLETDLQQLTMEIEHKEISHC